MKTKNAGSKSAKPPRTGCIQKLPDGTWCGNFREKGNEHYCLVHPIYQITFFPDLPPDVTGTSLQHILGDQSRGYQSAPRAISWVNGEMIVDAPVIPEANSPTCERGILAAAFSATAPREVWCRGYLGDPSKFYWFAKPLGDPDTSLDFVQGKVFLNSSKPANTIPGDF